MGSVQSRLLLVAGWAIALLAVLLIGREFQGESTAFYGIAEDHEQTIRFPVTVEIVQYDFVAGQAVEAGDLIVEVRAPELDSAWAVAGEKLHALTFGNREIKSTMLAQTVQLQADLRGQTSELDRQIRQLETQINAERDFVRGSSVQVAATAINGLVSERDSLRTQRRALRQSIQAQINDLNSRLGTSERPIDAQIAEVEKQREEIQRQREELRVLAKQAGKVGSVLFEVGEKVPPFQPILTVHGTQPTFVKGYIHESVLNQVREQQTVWVQAANSAHAVQWNEGLVEGLGSRIVAFPERLKVNPMVQAWGREVTVRLKHGHNFLLGEKVNVQLEAPLSFAGFLEQLKEDYLP